MVIQSSDSRSAARTIRITDQDGKPQDVCHISGSIKDGHMVSVQVSVMSSSSPTASCAEAVQEQVMSFISAVFTDAALTGIPVRTMSEAT